MFPHFQPAPQLASIKLVHQASWLEVRKRCGAVRCGGVLPAVKPSIIHPVAAAFVPHQVRGLHADPLAQVLSQELADHVDIQVDVLAAICRFGPEAPVVHALKGALLPVIIIGICSHGRAGALAVSGVPQTNA